VLAVVALLLLQSSMEHDREIYAANARSAIRVISIIKIIPVDR
jgi:hypothetical protein